MKSDQPERLPMTQTEKDMLRQLSRCTFLPGSWEKRFVYTLHFTLSPLPAGEGPGVRDDAA